MISFFTDYTLFTLLSLTILAFLAGFIDAVAGGGGLIQIPALLISFPQKALPELFGTNKIAAICGTSFAAYQYAKRIRYDFRLLVIVSAFSFIASALGAKTLSYIHTAVLRPVILVILILIAVYTFLRKDLGSVQTKNLSFAKQAFWASIMGIVVGFYDGFFGPGTGSFFVLGFVLILGFEFIQASAYAKVINCVTNLSALIVFVKQGNYIGDVALLMAIGNISGSVFGSRLALKKGNHFIRIVFLIIVILLIIRYSYDILYL